MATEAVTQSKTFVYYHTHWDREWYRTFRDYQIRLAEVIDSLLDRLEQGAFSCFTLDGQTIVLEDYLEFRPWQKERLTTFIRNGQINVGPWYVMPDEFLVSGESLVRNLKLGIEMSKAFNCHDFTGYLPDPFGHSQDIPTVLKKFGIDSAIGWRGFNPKHSTFFWEGPNGDKVLTYQLTGGYFANFLHDHSLSLEGRKNAAQELLEQIRQESPLPLMLLPVGGDHLGPIESQDRQYLFQSILGESFPEPAESTAVGFMNELLYTLEHGTLDGISAEELPKLQTLCGEMRDNSRAFVLPGVYSARLYLKKANRKLEHQLVNLTEPLLAINQILLGATPYGKVYPEAEMSLAWKLLLQNHPHDSICGCSIDAVHRENEARYETVSEIADSLTFRASYSLSEALATSREWILWNFSDQPYSGVVTVIEREPLPDRPYDERLNGIKDPKVVPPTGIIQMAAETVSFNDQYRVDPNANALPEQQMVIRHGWIWVEDIPANGFKKVSRRPDASKFPPKGMEVVIDKANRRFENQFYRLEIGTDGTVSIQDRQSGKLYPRLLQFRDTLEQGDSYNAAPVPGAPARTPRLKAVVVEAPGPLVGSIRLDYVFEEPELQMAFSTRIRLEAGSPLVQFETAFTNTAPNHKFQVLFPTGEPVETVFAESHFSIAHRRYDPSYDIERDMPVAPQKELRPNTGPIQRFFQANGQAWITEGLTEYEVFGESVGLTLYRGFSYLSTNNTGVRGAFAGPPFETPEAQCIGRFQVFRYAWCPAPLDVEQLYRLAKLFYGAVYGEQGRNRGQRTGRTTPLLAMGPHSQATTDSVAYSILSWDNPSIVSTALKWSTDRDKGVEKSLVVRLMNTQPTSQRFTLNPGFSFSHVWEVDFLEEPLYALDNLNVELKPLDIKTYRFYLT